MTTTQNFKTLSFDIANAICGRWTSIADDVPSYLLQLETAGFKAFLSRIQYLEAFAEGEDEILLHRRCAMELVRERYGQPQSLNLPGFDLTRIYRSPFLESLRRERDRENGCSERELSSRYELTEAALRTEIDPCFRRLRQEATQNPQAHRLRFAAVLEEVRKAAEDEAIRHRSVREGDCDFADEFCRYSFLTQIMEREAAAYGFSYDRAKSRAKYPVFSKTIVDGWDLCWSIEKGVAFFPGPAPGVCALSPYLHLRDSRLKGKLTRPAPGTTLAIAYAETVYSFSVAYWEVDSLTQLEWAVRAHLFLYGRIASKIEDGIRSVLIS